MVLTLFFAALAVFGGGALYVLMARPFGWVPLRSKVALLPSFADKLPLEDIQHDCYLLTDGSIVGGWELSGVDSEMRDPEEIAGQVQRLGFALNTLNPGVEVIVQCRRSTDITTLIQRFEQASAPRTPERAFLKRLWRRQVDAYGESSDVPFLDTRLYLFVRVGGDKRGNSLFGLLIDSIRKTMSGGLGARAEASATAAYREDLRQKLLFFHEQTRSMVGQLAQEPYSARRLTSVELDAYAKSILWSPERMRAGYSASRRPDARREPLAQADEAMRRQMQRDPAAAALFPASIRSQIGDIYYEAFADYVACDGRLIGLMRMSVSPEVVFPGLMTGFRSQLQFPLTFTARIRTLQKQAELERLRKETERRKITADTIAPGSAQADRGNIENYQESVQRYDDARDPSQQVFGVEITIAYEAKDDAELKDRADKITAYFIGLRDARMRREEFGADRIFRETLPFVIPRRDAMMKLMTDEIVALLPVFIPWHGSSVPIRLYRTATGDPWSFSPVDRKITGAQHSGTFGKTGAGKGVLEQLMCLYPALVSGDCDYILFDAGGTYKRAAQLLGGAYFEPSASSPEAINAFYISPVFYRLDESQQAEYLADAIKTAVNVTITLACPQTHQEMMWKSIASAVVTPLMREAVRTREEVLLHDVYAALQSYRNPEAPTAEAEARLMALNLRPYIHDVDGGEHGQFSYLFDRKQTFDGGTSDFLVVDVLTVQTNPVLLAAFVLATLAGLAWSRILRNAASAEGRFTRVTIDEIAAILNNPRVAEEVDRLYRQGRKFRAIAASLLQGIGDTVKADFKDTLGPIKEQMAVRFFLQHDRSAFATQALQDDGMMNLDPRIFELTRQDGHYSEVVVAQKTGLTTRFATVPLVPTPFENWLATTGPNDKPILAAYLQRYGAGSSYNLTLFEVLYLLAYIWPHGGMYTPRVAGASAKQFPPDELVRQVVAHARKELGECADVATANGWITPVPAPAMTHTAPAPGQGEAAATAPAADPVRSPTANALPTPSPESPPLRDTPPAPARPRTFRDIRSRAT